MQTVTQSMNPLHSSFIEHQLSGRYICNTHIEPLLSVYNTTVIGHSEAGLPIYRICTGAGKTKVLMWSQMHGNESTTTKSVFDLLRFLQSDKSLLETLQLSIIPILNPDGAKSYTRFNANQVDLNRDAIDLSQVESRILRKEFDEFSPDYAFNLHDQRTIFGVDTKPATLSLLAPALDKEQSFNDCRNKAAQLAASVFQGLQSSSIASQIGRFDDQFDPNCVGDSFQSLGVPTLLIEAGHYQDDYHREKTRTFVFNAYVLALQAISTSNFSDFSIYHSIPQNKKIFFDYLFRNVRYVDRGKEKTGDVGLQYKEVLNSNQIEFHPVFTSAGDLSKAYGHIEPNCENLEPFVFKIEESAQNLLKSLNL